MKSPEDLAVDLALLAINNAAHQLANVSASIPMDSILVSSREVCEDQAKRQRYLEAVADEMRWFMVVRGHGPGPTNTAQENSHDRRLD